MQIDSLGTEADGPSPSSTQDLPPVNQFTTPPKPDVEPPAPEPVVEDDGTEPEATPEPHHDEPKGVKKRIDELTAARKAAERRAELAEQRAHELAKIAAAAKELPPAPEPPPPPVEAPLTKPRKADFADPDAYDDAVLEWAASEGARRSRAEIAAAEARRAQDAEQQAQAATAQAERAIWEERRVAAVQKYADFDEVAFKPDLPITTAMAAAISAESNGADVAYYLGKNPQEAARIAALKPNQAFAAVVRLAMKLEDKPSTSKAPAPITPVGARAGAVSKSPHEMSMEEYAAQFNKRKS